ncbi:MAG: DUF983 domain-containing protein [Puniceicoccaceae bacterium]|nr:MAG: DUF983 domain-containing protein [Puniceicoccaceae bacterium]
MTEPTLDPLPKATRSAIIRRGLRGTCPNCGQCQLFASMLRIHRHCPDCGMTLERGNGYYLGPLCINYGFVALGFVAPLLLMGVGGWMPLKAALALALIGALLLPILLYRTCWSLWLMLYYLCLPDELHANRPEDSDDLLFEEDARR